MEGRERRRNRALHEVESGGTMSISRSRVMEECVGAWPILLAKALCVSMVHAAMGGMFRSWFFYSRGSC